MHWSVGHSDGKGQTQTDNEPHPDGEEACRGKICSMFDHVEASQHQHGVDEHEEPAADHLDAVEENCLRADVAKTEIKTKNKFVSFTSGI